MDSSLFLCPGPGAGLSPWGNYEGNRAPGLKEIMSKNLILKNLLSQIKDIVPDPKNLTTAQIDKAEDAIFKYISLNMSDEEKDLIGVLLVLQDKRQENRELIQLEEKKTKQGIIRPGDIH